MESPIPLEQQSTLGQMINDYGFPIIAAVGMGYFIYFIWQWVTKEIDPVIGEAQGVLIGLIDRIRMLDNDMIRLTQKLNMVLEFKEQYERMTGKKLDLDLDTIEKMKKEIQDVKITKRSKTKM